MRVVVLLSTSDRESKYSPLRSLLARRHPGRGHLLREDRVHFARFVIADRRTSTILFHDEMWHVAWHFCFTPLAALLEGRATQYRVMETGEIVELWPIGDRVIISSKRFAPLNVPRDPLVELLYRKGCDYIELLASLHGEGSMPLLQPPAEAARLALTSRGLSTARPMPWPDD